jgi:peptidylprolyl isomerase
MDSVKVENKDNTDAVKPKGFKLKPLHIALLVIVIGAIIGGIYVATGVAQPVVAAGDNVSVYYTGKFTNGTVFDTNVGQQPFNFTAGAGQVIPGFDQGVIGMKVGETRNITIAPAEGYGEINQSLIVTVPSSQFGNQSVQVGMVFTTSTGQEGKVTAVGSNTVTVDFNPPLAGQTLLFQIEVISIKK